MKLYRAVSTAEYDDYWSSTTFQTTHNTLEAKQFFKSQIGVDDYSNRASLINYDPPYTYVFIIDVDESCFNRIPADHLELDRHQAVTIHETDLQTFNACINFVEEYAL